MLIELIDKRTGNARLIYSSKEDIAKMIWTSKNQYGLSEMVKRASYEQLKAIEAILGDDSMVRFVLTHSL